MKVGLMSVGFPNFRYDIGEKFLKQSIEKIKNDGYELIYNDSILIYEEDIVNQLNEFKNKQVDLLILQCGTYSYGSIMNHIINEFRETPLLLWGFREPVVEGFRGLPLNSLCALNMYGSFLKKAEKRYAYVYGDVDEASVYEKVFNTIKAVNVKKALSHSVFCIIGGRVPGFYLSNVDELRLRYQIGIEIKYYSIAGLLDYCQKIDQERVNDEVEKIKNEVAFITTTHEMIEKGARIFLAIKDFKEINHIDAFTIKCWPEFQSLFGCSVCGVVSRLNNEGIMTSCEGDVSGLLTMYMQYLITKEPCFFVDFVNVNDKGIGKVWHCGPAPICMTRDASSTKYTEHPTIKQGMGFAAEFLMRQGRLIMMKISEGRERYRLFLTKGTGVDEDRDLNGNQADILFDSDPNHVIDTIMNHGIEHHYAIVYQDIEKELIEVCRWLNIDIIKA